MRGKIHSNPLGLNVFRIGFLFTTKVSKSLKGFQVNNTVRSTVQGKKKKPKPVGLV